MRRSFLFLGVALIAVSVGAAAYVKTNGEREREHHIVVVRDNALCEKSLEMAVSFSSYAKKKDLTDGLLLTNGWYTKALTGDLRRQAYNLGFTPYEYDAILLKARTDAERVLIPQINNASDPAAKALELALPCVPRQLQLHLN